jgi:superfamily I DNA and/or RNA helicase
VSRDAPPFLDELRALRRRLLLALLPVDRTNDTVPRARTDVLAVLTEARDDLDRRHRSSRDAADEAVWTFLSALEGDPEAVKQAVISYTSVFAATCQQCQPTSKHGDLAELKGINGSYDTVIVDEAARATPLDLFIPMSKASRRIVLVGDHRQLPHILDRELERELEEALSSESTAEQRTSEMLNESLFERLFKDLRKREERDGIRRTVTLDEQYRMHPVLGRFVSDQFYAPHGAHEAFRSPRPPEEFAHSLPGYGGPAAWLEVPQALGGETSGQSKSRPAEATAIVAELKRLMDSKEGRGLTFGVISFYSAQVDLIAEELERNGMLLRTEDGATEIVEPYRELRLECGRTAERLRVGTVDAFQGMEFDVVFLSMVRSNTYADTSEKDRRKKFGHLMSPNRLCVAMSRQKRLLIVAGDDTMLRSTHATTAIGPLVQFRELSEVRDAARL